MRSSTASLCLLALLAGSAVATFTSVNVQPYEPKHSLGFSFCNICTQFIGQGFSQLLNVILNAGVMGGCGELCSTAFANSTTEAKVCNVLCDGVGIYAFVKLIDKYAQYIDPIYFCEELHTCPVVDGGAAKIDKITVTPPSGPQGTEFEIDLFFDVTNQTGTGEIAIAIVDPEGMALGDATLNTGMAPGQYSGKFTLDAEPSEQESFSPGNYKVEINICEGECGAPYPHTKLLASGMSNFTITRE